MSKYKLAAVLMGLGMLLTQIIAHSAPLAIAERNNQPQYVQDQVLIKFKPNLTAAARAQIAQSYGLGGMQMVSEQSGAFIASLIPGQKVEQAVSALTNDPNVEHAQPNYIYHALAVPTDPQYGQVWAAKNTGQPIAAGTYATNNPGVAGNDMSLESAWNLQTDCSSVVVAVVDTGINYNSEDLAANMWNDPLSVDLKHGRNFAPDVAIGANSDPMDLAGHGTHVAGTIGAAANAVGGVGVCWVAKLMAVRVLDATGYGTAANIIAGIDYATSKGAKVINMSLGGTGGFDSLYSAAITRAQNADVLLVVAAGNDNQNNDSVAHWPCNFTHANLICVAALDQAYSRASFSDYGATSVDVGAPGTNIYSTWAGTSATITDAAFTGWTYSSTTAGAGGGWATAAGWLSVPSASWGVATYNASTDDRVYKTFNLSGVNAATLSVAAAINVKNLDYFLVNYKSAGGDPSLFAGSTGTNAVGYTNWHDGNLMAYSTGQINITPCISATCSIGFQLVSNATTPKDYGVTMTNFTITTMTNTTNSYNTINGTSMATPNVAGVAALVRAYNPSFTYADVAGAIKNGGRSIAALSGITTTGKAVDARGALIYINPPSGITVTVH